MTILFKDRKTGSLCEEKVAGEDFLKWSCETRAGRLFTALIGRHKGFSSLFGKIQNMRFSKRHVTGFIEEMKIDLKESLRESAADYSSFNDFFTRKLKPSSRPVDKDPHRLVSPADGRLLACERIQSGRLFQVKGMYFTVEELLGDERLASLYEGGSAVILRLNPTDYHRFHFPADGIARSSRAVEGYYYSVNPIVLSRTERVFSRNRREVMLLETKHFGTIAMVEVGAALVGSIRQTYEPDAPVTRGMEKGYFQFGGSTVIMLFEPETIMIDHDLILNSEEGYETLVKMGEGIGRCPDQN